jgi:hypothetical protein
VNKIALGTAQFGANYGLTNKHGKISLNEAKSILQLSRKYAINVIDTAVSYGNSEENLGQIGVKKFDVVTKLPALPDGYFDAFEWVWAQVTSSLDRLQKDNLSGLLLHRPEQLLGSKGLDLYRGLQSLKDAGKVDKLGISIYSTNELDDIISRYEFDLVQAPFNLIDRQLHTSGWMSRLKDLGIEIHTRSAFLQGLLLIPENEIPVKFSKWKGLFRKWHYWLEENAFTKVEACIRFPLMHKEIDKVIVGVDSASQLKQILKATEFQSTNNFPDICSSDSNLINPSNWGKL